MIQSIEPIKHLDAEERFSDYFAMDVISNITDSDEMAVAVPEHEMVVGVYSALLVIGAVGNVAVFYALMSSRRRKSRVNLLMTHLVVADMMIGWRTTNAWLAGNVACKFFLVLRAFGLYLSSNVLVCISVDSK
ncbi:Neuropeptide receptor A28 [Operophtera brumata]|uniref:Neuropeptide receptor A28 n=1 Tax=Operophtera brumata TaxID=104452 RepID=A0A0L7L522_OPEBR|nr:Neuropeptide receptor A28 [Operophtera brumata]